MRGKVLAAAVALAGGLMMGGARAADRGESAVPNVSCDRACLTGVVDQYMKAFVAKDWRRIPWADHVSMTENNTPMKVGDGAWAVVTGKGPQDLIIADPTTGQAGFMGVVELNNIPTWFALRMKVVDRKVAEVEYIWRPRPATVNPNAPGGNDPRNLQHDPLLTTTLPPAERVSRGRMVDLSNGYFSTLQKNDGHIFTQFDPACSRNDNGIVTAGVPDSPNPMYRQSCEDQFKTGRYMFDNAMRERGFFLIDEEKGVVMARGFLDHDAQIVQYKLNDGTEVTSGFKTPHSFLVFEVFKYRSGKLLRAEVIHIDVPYHSSSPWTPRALKE